MLTSPRQLASYAARRHEAAVGKNPYRSGRRDRLADRNLQAQPDRKGALSGHGGGVGPGHELVDLAGGVAVDEPGEEVGEVGLGIDRVELAGLDQGGDWPSPKARSATKVSH
jgi:hypothetical protein